MPKKRDVYTFQESHYGLDLPEGQTYDQYMTSRDADSATAAGFESVAEERIDRLSRTHEGATELILNGEVPVNTENSQVDFSGAKPRKEKITERQINAQRNSL